MRNTATWTLGCWYRYHILQIMSDVEVMCDYVSATCDVAEQKCICCDRIVQNIPNIWPEIVYEEQKNHFPMGKLKAI